jgi:hypothetical protein
VHVVTDVGLLEVAGPLPDPGTAEACPVLVPGPSEVCPVLPPLLGAPVGRSDIAVDAPPSTVAIAPTDPPSTPKKKTSVLKALTTHCAAPPDVTGSGVPRSGPADE